MKQTMKKIFMALMFTLAASASAMPLFNVPTTIVQPNGDTLHCFVSGDEYYHRLHDADGYTIVQNPQTGWWVFADTVHTAVDRWQVVPTSYVAGATDPHTVATLHPNIGVDQETWLERQQLFDRSKAVVAKTSGRNHGRMNNIVIFVRFSDQLTELGTLVSSIDPMLNDSATNANSMYSYFKQVSYNKLEIVSHYFPTPVSGAIACFRDNHPRSYYLPYNSTSNPDGYNGDPERTSRQQGLVRAAVEYISQQVPDSLDLDIDNDGFVDNVCLVVKGDVSAWGDILWPHKSILSDSVAYIGGKQVYNYNILVEGPYMYHLSSGTFCHEMFHTLGAPDIYHYNTNTSVYPAGNWDLMCQHSNMPQHMSAYMKWKYGNWLDSIPEITRPGTYTLHSLGDSTHNNCCYRIATTDPHQWYVLEYRDNTERFETTLSGKGLLIYRIDDRYTGCSTNHDEVYLFRPNASNATTNGTPALAFFSGSTPRTEFTPQTNPHPWLTGGVPDPTFAIVNITVPDSTISFTYAPACVVPHDLTVSGISGTTALLSWQTDADSTLLQWRTAGSSTADSIVVAGQSHQLTALIPETSYQWRVRSICSAGNSSAFSDWNTLATDQCDNRVDEVGIADTSCPYLPFYTQHRYSYTQMIYRAAELGGPLEIRKLAFNYADNRYLRKSNVIVYLGTTADSAFSAQNSSFIPLTQLHKVYQGLIQLTTSGWIDIELDSSFYYNGTDNLVVAFDDNSGTYSSNYYPWHHFYCTSTQEYTSVARPSYDGEGDIDPATATRNAIFRFRADIRISGCPMQAVPSYNVTVEASDSTQGNVDGGGTYDIYAQATITATPAPGYRFDYWLSDGDTITANPYTFGVIADRAFVAYFADSGNVSVASCHGNSPIRIERHEGGLVVAGATGEDVALYDVVGRCHWRSTASGHQYIPIRRHGVYVLRIGGQAVRKIVF